MKQFRELYEAAGWVNSNALGECTVIVHGDPYKAKKHNDGTNGWWLQRQYTTNFYIKN